MADENTYISSALLLGRKRGGDQIEWHAAMKIGPNLWVIERESAERNRYLWMTAICKTITYTYTLYMLNVPNL